MTRSSLRQEPQPNPQQPRMDTNGREGKVNKSNRRLTQMYADRLRDPLRDFMPYLRLSVLSAVRLFSSRPFVSISRFRKVRASVFS